MNRSRTFALVLVSLSMSLPAQQEPKPAPQLDKLKPLAGHWEGSGSAAMQPGQPPAKWKSVGIYQWAMDGFWLQCDTAIEFEGMPGIRFREYLGWDGENQRYVNVAVNNMGEAAVGTLHLGEGEMLLVLNWLRQGEPQVERARTKFTADRMEFTVTFLGAEGAAVDAVQGVMKRVAKVEVPPLTAAKGMMPAPAQMASIVKMAGAFDLVGEMIMVPGAPATKIKGRDTITPLFDGSIVVVETKGEADQGGPAYVAHGFYAWSPADKCYQVLSLDNMGMVMAGQGHLVGQDLIVTMAGPRMGMPAVARTILSLDQDGRPAKVVNHSCMGTAPPMQDFSGTYTRAK